MNNRLPAFLDKDRICIICEGDEEYDYLKKLKELEVWNDQYEVILDNAGGNGNIPARYQDRYQNGSYEMVLVFCDTEKKPYEQYEDIKRKINEFHGIGYAAGEVIMYANPCTMQVILKHWSDVRLKSPAKKVNAPIIEEFTGVKNYKGREDQREEMMKHITAENYQDMYNRIKKIPNDDAIVGSSNFDKLLNYLSDNNNGWIHEINTRLDGMGQ